MTTPQTVASPTRPPLQLSMPLDSVRLRGMDPSQRATVIARLASLLMEAAGIVAGERDDDGH
jgi:hypothetical protein